MNVRPEIKNSIRDLLSEPSYATTLHAIALLSLDPDYLYSSHTEFTEIFADLQDMYNVVIHESNKQKLQALITAITTDNFFSEPSVFHAISNTLLHGDPMFDIEDELTIVEILWSIYEVSVNIENFDDIPFALSVQKLIAKEVLEEAEDTEELIEIAEEEYFVKFVIENRIRLWQELKLIFTELELKDLPELDLSNV